MSLFIGLLKLLEKIPPKVFAYLFLVISLVAIGFFWGRSGPTRELREYKAAQAAVVNEVGQKSAEATAKVVTQYVDKIQYVKVAGDTITKEVPVYVPRNVCILPDGFRRVHDAAVSGSPISKAP